MEDFFDYRIEKNGFRDEDQGFGISVYTNGRDLVDRTKRQQKGNDLQPILL